MRKKIILGAVYVNRSNHEVVPTHIDVRGGRVNSRVLVNNHFSGHNETWSVRLFHAEHTGPLGKPSPAAHPGRFTR